MSTVQLLDVDGEAEARAGGEAASDGHSYEHLDLLHDGFYSIVFDPVPGATGFELAWETSGTWKHWSVREIEAYGY